MKFVPTLCLAATLALLSPTQSWAASSYKCKANVSLGNVTITFKKGRARAAGHSFKTKIQSDGSIQLETMGETVVLLPNGQVVDRSGSKSGKHSCDLEKVTQALNK